MDADKTRSVPSRAVLFDLDGTLVDSAPDIAAAMNVALAAFGIGPLSLAEITPMLGAGARKAVDRALAACSAPADHALAHAVHEAYVAAYDATPCVHTVPYQGCSDALERLRADGWSLAVVTNKPHPISLSVIEALNLAPLFSTVVGAQEGLALKPAADMLHAALNSLNTPSSAIFVGDSKADVGAARAAGLPVIVMSHGYTTIPPRELGADIVIDHFDELHAAITALAQP